MAADLRRKKLNYVTNLVEANRQLLNLADVLDALAQQWSSNSYPTGAQPPENNITDEDLAGSSHAYMTAEQLNQLLGAHASVLDAVAANRGYLEAARP